MGRFMESTHIRAQQRRCKRSWRVRKKLAGTGLRPRLSVFKSNKHIAVQLIDDDTGVTLGSTSTFAKEFRNSEFNRRNKTAAKQLGTRISEIAKEKGIRQVIFDRGPFKYHGVLAELANAAREGGLEF